MKYIRIFLIAFIAIPFGAHAASDFQIAAQLLSAAKNADIQQVQILVNSGANINYVDSTGLSLVCTALMNKDYRAAQILQMYGADASRCDQQIKQYNSRTKPVERGGLFGGLSSAQTLTLAAAGAAVVIGGVLWLTGVLDFGNNNDDAAYIVGSRPGGDGGGTPSGNATAWNAPALPYGPSLPNAAADANLASAMNYYSPSKPAAGTSNILYDNFQTMSKGTSTAPGQNYLLMMHGYAPLARGYLGMRTIRDLYSFEPLSLKDIALGGVNVGGGRPVNVAMITDNGINASDNSSLGDKLMPWTMRSGTSTVGGTSTGTVSSKYYNNRLSYNNIDQENIWNNFTTVEDAAFDLSGHGTAIHNGYASVSDNMKAKIVGGKDSGYADGDFFGFMPNGQMTIYRTGGGMGFQAPADGDSASGTYTMTDGAFTTSSTITINGTQYTISEVTGNLFTAVNDEKNYVGYIFNNSLYFDSDGDGVVDQMFAMTPTGGTGTGGELELSQTLQPMDYQNYKAMYSAFQLYQAGDQQVDTTGSGTPASRSAPSVIANTSVIDPLRDLFSSTMDERAATIADMLYFINQYPNVPDNAQKAFLAYVNKYYDVKTDDGLQGTNYKPSGDALSLFNDMGAANSPLLVFSTGSYETDSGWTGMTKEATFENAAPLAWKNLEHLFMSVVAVGLTGAGTNNATDISGFAPSSNSKYALSKWYEEDDGQNHYFKARKCGIAGRGANGIDPWCFAAAGITDEYATAAASGAAGALISAFGGSTGFLTNQQIFALMALTADGPYLGTTSSGTAFTAETLAAYLQSMYEMPEEDEYRWTYGGEDYLDVFKDVFGYGLINLERATTPGTKIYYFNGTDIVSGSGNGYWRAASNTRFRSSSAFNPRAAYISAPFYDILESIDGEMTLPRIWKNEFALGTSTARGLYMGDTLGELTTRAPMSRRVQIGNIGFSMTTSDKPYNDYMGGLDDVRLDYGRGNWSFAGGYQRHLVDGASRFDGRVNPIMALASNAVVSDAEYGFGKWSFGARAFAGAITDEGILQNDPTIASQYMPAELGLIHGAQSFVGFSGDRFGFTASVGNAVETETILGAQTGGLLNLGAGNTTYVDTELRYRAGDDLTLTLRSTFAHTTSDATGEFILGMTSVDSDAFSFGVDAGRWNLTVAAPLAVRRGILKYAHAEYEIIESDDGKYELGVNAADVANLALAPTAREVRISGTYRHSFGEFTDGAFGFIYRVNPNNTREFGNESIFMMKMTHRIGI